MPWNRGSSQTGIRNICRQKLLDEVLLASKVQYEWKVLVVDEFAMKVVSSCFKTEEIMACNIALIETLEEVREPLIYLEAIYMLQSTAESTKHLKVDLNPTGRMYKNASLVFLSSVPDDIFDNLTKTVLADVVKSFIEIDVMFLPRESQVYSLHDPQFFSAYFDAFQDVKMAQYEMTAKKLVTLFATLKEIPFIRYRRDCVKNLILAETIEQEFELQKDSFKELSDIRTTSRKTSILLILDRGFDCVSPVVHEFTFQAMAYDLLNIKDDIYEFMTGYAEGKMTESVPLSDEDSLWRQLRHEHIANVTRTIQNMFEADDLMKSTKHISSDVLDLPSLNEAIKKHLQLKSHERFFAYRYMANEIMKLYCEGINVIYQLEQNLSTRKDSEKRRVSDMYQAVTAALVSPNVELPQKLRLLLLYIFYNKGISKLKFDEILNKTQIPVSEAYTITNVLHLDVDLFKPGYCEPIDLKVPKKEIETVSRFKQSRWTPVINDILLGSVDGTLSEVDYPFLSKKPDVSFERTGYWCSDKKSDKVNHLVVFIAGGVTYSEMRCAYEVMSKYKGWDIFIGGDDILTPNIFIEKLKELQSFIS